MKKIITLIILLLFFTFILSGCTQTSYESDVKKTNDNSDNTKDTNNTDDSDNPSEVCYWDWETTRVGHIGEYTEYFGYPYEAKEGYDFLIVTLKIVNYADQEVTTNPWSWELNADGISFSHHFSTYDESIGHTTVDVEKGGSFTTKMVFEVPESTSDATMEYESFLTLQMVFDDSLLP